MEIALGLSVRPFRMIVKCLFYYIQVQHNQIAAITFSTSLAIRISAECKPDILVELAGSHSEYSFEQLSVLFGCHSVYFLKYKGYHPKVYVRKFSVRINVKICTGCPKIDAVFN